MSGSIQYRGQITVSANIQYRGQITNNCGLTPVIAVIQKYPVRLTLTIHSKEAHHELDNPDGVGEIYTLRLIIPGLYKTSTLVILRGTDPAGQ